MTEVHSSTVFASPPAKRTRKAIKCRCEVELLRESFEQDELQHSPISQSDISAVPAPVLSLCIPQARSISPLPLHQSTSPLPAPESYPPTPSTAMPVQPAAPSAESPLQLQLTPPTLALSLPPASPPRAAPPASAPPAAPSEEKPPESLPVGPPTPPPFFDAFSNDPDCIICRKCCKRSYVFRWYSHCYMCHLNEMRT